jgi:hypothetical protein
VQSKRKSWGLLHQERDDFRITHFWKCIVPFFATTHLFLVIYHF